MTQEILSRLDLIAAKLGQTAAALWPHAVRHTAIKSAAEIGIWVGFAVLSFTLISVGAWAGSREKFKEGPWIFPCVAGGILAFMLLLSASLSGSDAIAGALEPTGQTVKSILRNR